MSNKELNLFAVDKKVPTFLTDVGTSVAGDGVTAEDIAVPQLKIIQPLSPEIHMNIPDCKPGLFINDVTHDLFDKIYVINLMYEHNFGVFKSRDNGGGKVAQAATLAEALEEIATLPGTPIDYQVVDTGVHRMLGLNPDGTPYSPLIMYCSGTRKRISQRWNTQLQLRGEEFNVPRFASVWELSITTESNTKGTWYSFKTEFAGLIQDASLFEKANTMRTSMEAMQKEWVPQLSQASS